VSSLGRAVLGAIPVTSAEFFSPLHGMLTLLSPDAWAPVCVAV
jgi:hypothetical protein